MAAAASDALTGSFSSDEGSDQRGSYSPSADVSESEGSSDSNPAWRYPSACVALVAAGSGGDGPVASSASSSPIFPTMDDKELGCATPAMPQPTPPPPPADLAFWDADGKQEKRGLEDFCEVEMMKERFAKLLLGEDMSGSGKGVCTALAISNAITNLSATVFGELWRLEPLPVQKKLMWRREMECLLSVSDYIVDLIPSHQEFPGGGTFEVMVSRSRSDLFMNLPALRKLDDMLLLMLDGFRDTEFWYVDRGILVADGEEGGEACVYSSSVGPSLRREDKWWLPCPRVPANGLSAEGRRKLQQCRDCASQILKAAMAINCGVLVEMEIPDAYIETLPKGGKSCLGDVIYRYITGEQFSSECLLDCLDLSSEHRALETANRIEAAVYYWRLKDHKMYPNRSNMKKSWSGKLKDLVNDSERSRLLSQRAECLLECLRRRHPGLPQTALDMNKIQYNRDVGQAIIESYSRVMESLAFNIMARIDDVVYVDDTWKKSESAGSASLFNPGGLGGLPIQKKISPSPFSINATPYASPFATPAYCSSTPVGGSPGRAQQQPLSKDGTTFDRQQQEKLEKLEASGEMERVWSYTGNLSSRRDAVQAQERD